MLQVRILQMLCLGISQACARILSTQELQPGSHTNRLGLCQVVEIIYSPSWQDPTPECYISYFKLIMTMANCTYSYPVLP